MVIRRGVACVLDASLHRENSTKEGPVYLSSTLTPQPRPAPTTHQDHKPVSRSGVGQSGSFRHTPLITLCQPGMGGLLGRGMKGVHQF